VLLAVWSVFAVRLLREELQLLQEPGSYVGEVIKVMGKTKVLVKVHPEGKYVVDLDKGIDINDVTTGARVALRNDSYTLHLLLPTKVDPLVSLMKVEKVPDSTYDMIGGLDQQIKEIKEVRAAHSPLCLLQHTYASDLHAVEESPRY
jgi:26S proteasome regulatory subunit T6